MTEFFPVLEKTWLRNWRCELCGMVSAIAFGKLDKVKVTIHLDGYRKERL